MAFPTWIQGLLKVNKPKYGLPTTFMVATEMMMNIEVKKKTLLKPFKSLFLEECKRKTINNKENKGWEKREINLPLAKISHLYFIKGKYV